VCDSQLFDELNKSAGDSIYARARKSAMKAPSASGQAGK